MGRLSRLKPSDKVEVIDSDSISFGKRGEVIHIWSRRETMINKPASSEVKVYCQVKLEDTGTMTEFHPRHLKKIH
jgi:hypothetical protein